MPSLRIRIELLEAEWRRKNESLQEQLAEKQHELSEASHLFESTSEQQVQAVQRLQTQLDSLTEQQASLLSQNNVQSIEISRLSSERVSLSSQLASLRKQHDTLEREYKEQSAALDKLKTEHDLV